MKIPKLARLLAEDFTEQSSWIGKLVGPINSYFEFISTALNKNLTLTDNLKAEIKTIELNGTWPVKVAIGFRPVTVIVGHFYRTDGTANATDMVVKTTTGDTTSGSVAVSSLANANGIWPGLYVTGTGVPDGTRVVDVNVGGLSFNLSAHATATGTGVALTFTNIDSVGVNWEYNQSGQLQINGVTGIIPTPSTKYKIVLECKAG